MSSFITCLRRSTIFNISKPLIRGCKNKNSTQAKANRVALHQLRFTFKGAFAPGRFTKKELKLLKQAELAIIDWNKKISKREEAAKNQLSSGRSEPSSCKESKKEESF